MFRLPPFLMLCLSCLGAAAEAQPPNTATYESTMTVTVDKIERSNRVVIFRGDGNVLHTVYIDPKVPEFDTLKVGDLVTVRYVESVIVQVRPNAKLTAPADTTAEARKAGDEDVIGQLQAIVTIENIDPQRLFVTYRTHDNRRIVRAVRDKALLNGIRTGDRVEITVTRTRAIGIERPRR